MKLMFSWQTLPDGDRSAYCVSDRLNSWGISPLASALGDDGGLGITHSIEWIDDGINKAQIALTGATSTQHWARECFALEFQRECGSAFSLLEPDCAEELPTKALLAILEQWEEFLVAGPDAGPRTLEIAES
ncbi:MAG: hypothetical protein V4764_21930 [Burkholderia sp.]